MDSAAGDFHAVFEGLALSFEARESRQKRGMDVKDFVREGGDESGRDGAHVAGPPAQVNVAGFEAGDDVGVVLGGWAALGDKGLVREAEFGCGFEAAGIGYVR